MSYDSATVRTGNGKVLTVPPEPSLYSIGHSNLEWEDFAALLEKYSIEALADVRSAPYSKYSPHFTRAVMERELTTLDIRYIFMGGELGGRPNNGIAPSKSNRWRLYREMVEQPSFNDGVNSLLEQAGFSRTAMMCSEGDPSECHRYLLITNALADKGEPVSHILRDGSIEDTENIPTYGQLPQLYSWEPSLF